MTFISTSLRRLFLIALAALLLPAAHAVAQRADTSDTPLDPLGPPTDRLIIRPMLGVQTMLFNGDYQVRRHLQPITEEPQPFGGGFMGPSNGVHVEVEIVPGSPSLLRFPVSFDAFFLNGKTTFLIPGAPGMDSRRYTITHTAQIYSLGTGVRAAFFRSPNLYLSAEGRLNYIPPTELNTRYFVLKTDSTISKARGIPDSNTHVRLGAYFKIGTQVEFFDPLLLDFSIGYGLLNVLGRETDPVKQRELLVIEQRPAPETMLGYLGVGFSIIWRL